jgi:hypothetical protein
MDMKTFADVEATHDHEEKLRLESMALIEADPELSRRLEMVQKAMVLIFGYTIEYTSRSEDETTAQLPCPDSPRARLPGRPFAMSRC